MEKKRNKYAGGWKEAKVLLWARRKKLAIGLCLLFANRLASMVLPASTKFVIDEVIGNENTEMLTWLGLAAGAATLIQAITSFFLSLMLGVAAQHSISDMRMQVQKRLARLPVRYFDDNKSGVLISRVMTDAEGLRNLVGTGFVQLIGGILTSSVALSVLFYLSWRLTSLTLVLLVSFGAIMVVGFSKLRPIFRLRGKLTADLTGRLSEFLGGIRIVKAYTAEKREEILFAKGAHVLLRNITASMVGVSAITASATFLFGGIGVMMMVMGGSEVVAGRMSLGDMFMYVFFIGLMVAPLIQMSSIGTQITEALAGLDRIREILNEPEEAGNDAELTPIKEMHGDIVFDQVEFEYEENTPVLKGVSFRADAGSTTALVGSSGSGKSTLISLIMAFNYPQSGKITIDGLGLQTVRLMDYRSNLGIVLQENFLFDGTIAENIRYGKPNAKIEDIQAVSKVAHCDEFIEKFKDRYDTVVGERGVKLSGGQRQRIAIARALLADPKILILDEATSSLDSESEALIQDGLRALLRGRTTFVIAHRLSTIRTADQILVLEDGQIVERGNHDELLKAEGRYRELYDKQYQFEKNLFVNPGEELMTEENSDS